MEALGHGEADILELAKVVVGDPLHDAARTRLPWYRLNHGASADTHHRASLDGGFEQYLAGRSRHASTPAASAAKDR